MGVAGPRQLGVGRMTDMTRPAAPTRAQTYLNLALFAFALLGLELVLLAVEPVLRLRPDSVTATVIHWTLTIILWVGGAIGLGPGRFGEPISRSVVMQERRSASGDGWQLPGWSLSR